MVTRLVRSGLSSTKTSAVITLVMLAIGRLACPFSCQRTSPVSGLKAIAAAARRSGTSDPDSSVRNRGVMASFRAAAATRTRAASRAFAAARARARRALRALALEAEYAGLLATGFFAADLVTVFLAAERV